MLRDILVLTNLSQPSAESGKTNSKTCIYIRVPQWELFNICLHRNTLGSERHLLSSLWKWSHKNGQIT